MERSLPWKPLKESKMAWFLALAQDSRLQKVTLILTKEISHPSKVCKLLKALLSALHRATSRLCRPLKEFKTERSAVWRAEQPPSKERWLPLKAWLVNFKLILTPSKMMLVASRLCFLARASTKFYKLMKILKLMMNSNSQRRQWRLVRPLKFQPMHASNHSMLPKEPILHFGSRSTTQISLFEPTSSMKRPNRKR